MIHLVSAADIVTDTQTTVHCNERLVFVQDLMFVRILASVCLGLSLWLIGTVRAEPETVIIRAWVQSPDPAE